ncbi:hypothetical protein DRE_00048 [Drechslerella stenobrocha 248]|uniref:Carboxymuconolactone decarboxylase-like domain-containing protein n=1 Tax=Drechslerella stenobrocha 248 TaxID=1043628 RepID=W7I8V3_9PEZI|nr:hypothetical protein DRE_00048 [Drechslerella stenobrocha 248]
MAPASATYVDPCIRTQDEVPYIYPPERTLDEAIALFNETQATFPKSLGDETWYLVLLATLTYGSNEKIIAALYTHLTSQPRYATSEARQVLIRRIRETLVKLVALIGVCKPLAAIWKIAEVEREEDRDYSFSREGWQPDEAYRARGDDWFGQIYKHNLPQLDDRFAAHKDFGWISHNITYGLYLSDHTIIGGVDTEVVTLSAILIQNQPATSAFHLRGCRRIGISAEDVEAIQVCD